MNRHSGPSARKHQIVLGAFEALRKSGLPNLSYDAVAHEAGMTRQLVRYHFERHEDLMIAVCDYLASLYREALVSTAGKLNGSARVDAFLDFYFDFLDNTPKPRDDQIYDAMLCMAARSEPIKHQLQGQYKMIGQVLSQEFEVQYSELDAASAEELSYLFVCLMYGHWKMVASLGFAEKHRHISRQAMDRLIRSYREQATANEVTVWACEPAKKLSERKIPQP